MSFMSLHQADIDAVSNIAISSKKDDSVRIGKVCILPPNLASIAINNSTASAKELLLLIIKKIASLQHEDWVFAQMTAPKNKNADDIKAKDIFKAANVKPSSKNCIIGNVTGYDISFNETQDEDDSQDDELLTMGVLDTEFAKMYLQIL